MLKNIDLEKEYLTFTQFYSKNHSHIYRLALASLKNPQDAKDLAQEVFVGFIKAKAKGDEEIKSRESLTAIAHNLIKKEFRRRNNHKVISFEEVERIGGKKLLQLAIEELDPAELIEQKEMQLITKDALDKLPQNYQLILKLHYFQELNYKEISVRMERNEEALRALNYRAVKALGKALLSYFDCKPKIRPQRTQRGHKGKGCSKKT